MSFATMNAGPQRRRGNLFLGPETFLPPITTAAFSQQVYVGDGGASRLLAGADLSAGGVVWIKSTGAQAPDMYFSPDGVTILRYTTSAPLACVAADATMSAAGLTLTTNRNNQAAITYVAYQFQRRSRMVDVVFYTGDGNSNRALSHGLLVKPGIMFVGRNTAAPTGNRVYTNRKGANFALSINGTTTADYSAAAAGLRPWNNVEPTASQFTVGFTSATFEETNITGNPYFAVLFANDTNADGVIQVPNWTGTGIAPGPTVTMGWQPRTLIFGQTFAGGGADGFCAADSMRGFGAGTPRLYLSLSNGSDSGWSQPAIVSATGFQVNSVSIDVNGAGSSYYCIALKA